ncbi:MAG: bifunctional phosphopantothenoylcysteine decarboxylase/phosphopantothenate--cysteine ligase CoaBC [Selenomonadaceae bacterium]|nr:bifunctional phosphopantothenoylcysteine decarboxylase/phosphopantothenate--cysteine ligase CoaBC [Selenomonadaceae bacterium]MBQ7630074.1 bifunctional phosphopantothenoylcysteine decarboxylase/phosphopantothenate--cysteine ligase CoaBC [Selenomonadaceae bacterium]
MKKLSEKNILLGVTGGIAAYKSVEIASRLKKFGANVKVIMTRAATEFVTPRTFQEITKNPVAVEMFADIANFDETHIALANFADVVLIAPATANFIAKVAHGIADDLLTTTILATPAQIIISPAMNTVMWENPATQDNLKILVKRGVKIIEPATGELACGTIGKGRLPEPEKICAEVVKFFGGENNADEDFQNVVTVSSSFGEILTVNEDTEKLHGKKILVTAGGTVEPIDPVRYIGNRSSGRMGYEIANAAQLQGAEVILISTVNLPTPKNVKLVKVETAEEMRAAVLDEFDLIDAVIMSAAVSDYRVRNVAAQKIKKSAETLTLELVKNPDILKELGQLKKSQVLIGFAAETENLIEYAQKKLEEKNLEMIVANNVAEEGAGFAVDTNIATLIYRNGRIENFPKMSKAELAEKIINRVAEFF